MNAKKKQAIAKVIIKILKSRFDTFPEYASSQRNAPFHKAFLEAFSEKIDRTGTNLDALISMSSWIHGLNTTIGQVFSRARRTSFATGTSADSSETNLRYTLRRSVSLLK